MKRGAVCPTCGTNVPGRGTVIGEWRVLGATIRGYEDGRYVFDVFEGKRLVFRSDTIGIVTVGSSQGRFDYWGRTKPRPDCDKLSSKLAVGCKESLRQEIAARWLAPGRDLTGDGRPNLLIFSLDGRGPADVDLFELRPQVRHLQRFALSPMLETFDPSFVDLDSDGYPEIVHYDGGELSDTPWIRGHHPTVRVVLKFKQGQFRLTPTLMKKPAPPLSVLRKEAARLSRQLSKASPLYLNDVWKRVVELLYSGHPNLARRFFDLAWPAGKVGKKKAFNELRQQFEGWSYPKAVQRLFGQL